VGTSYVNPQDYDGKSFGGAVRCVKDWAQLKKLGGPAASAARGMISKQKKLKIGGEAVWNNRRKATRYQKYFGY
jgi:hypothetical protein